VTIRKVAKGIFMKKIDSNTHRRKDNFKAAKFVHLHCHTHNTVTDLDLLAELIAECQRTEKDSLTKNENQK